MRGEEEEEDEEELYVLESCEEMMFNCNLSHVNAGNQTMHLR